MKKQKRKITLPEYYNTLDSLPILVWEKLHEQKDLSLLLLKPKKLTKAQKILLSKVFKNLHEEFLRVFGLEENRKAILAKRIQIATLKLKMQQTKDPATQNFIKRRENELEKLINYAKGSRGDIYKAKMIIEKKLGTHLPLKDISVREFYTYMKELK